VPGRRRPTRTTTARRARGPLRWAVTLTLSAGLALAATGTAAGTATAAARPATVSKDVADAPVPAVPAGLPTRIEDPSPYLKQVSCDPGSKPGAAALAALLVATYPGTTAGIGRPCGTDGIASEHYEGRAVDWMTSVREPQGAARAEALIGWLLAPDAQGHAFANARRLGVMYIIWNNRIWGSYSASSGWRPYSTCATHPDPAWDTSCHRNHVHLSLSWAGATGRTSFWTRQVAPVDYGPCRPADLNWAAPHSGRTASPCPSYSSVAAPAGTSAAFAALWRYSGATVGVGSSGPVVTAVQKALGVTADGDLGPVSGAAVSAFRTAHGLRAGTTVDAATWRALLAAAAVTGPDGSTGASSTTSTGSAAAPPPAARPAAPKSPLAPYARTTLAYGSTGAGVLALQRALRVTPLSGWYGPVTKAAVAAFQTRAHLTATGAVDAATWRALGA
jgi:peptidoglycan hydrolase-like protein with peptidoglycan-binding domain